VDFDQFALPLSSILSDLLLVFGGQYFFRQQLKGALSKLEVYKKVVGTLKAVRVLH
jgi:hypothetical protein